MTNVHWSAEENNILIENYAKIDLNDILLLLPKRTLSGIWNHARLLNLTKRYDIRSYNEHVFDDWTEESAYWLGFLYADGNMAKCYQSISLELADKDYDHICKFRDWIAPGAIIYKKDARHTSTMRVNNIYIYNKLLELGMFPNKSNKIGFPISLPEEFYNHFVRGVYDGDGCTSLSNPDKRLRADLVASHIFMVKLQEILVGKIDFVIGYQKSKNCLLSRVGFYAKKANIFLKWLYNDAHIFLERKKSKFDEYNKYQEQLHGVDLFEKRLR